MEQIGMMPPQGGEPSLAGQAPNGMPPAVPGEEAGVTEKQQFEELIMQIPIEELIKMVQGMSPEEMGQMIQQLCVQQGMSQEEAISMSITLMKVIYERIQEETGQAVTDLTGQTGQQQEPSLAGPPEAPPQMPPQMPGGGA